MLFGVVDIAPSIIKQNFTVFYDNYDRIEINVMVFFRVVNEDPMNEDVTLFKETRVNSEKENPSAPIRRRT